MSNFDTARDALETSMNSSGSAMKEHEKWQQSLEAQINKLKASWQGLSQAFLKSDFLHGALDAVIGLVDGLTLLIDKVGVLPTLLTGFSIFKSFGNKGLFKTFNNDLDGFTNKVGIASKSFSELMNAFSSANTGGIKGFFNGLKSMGDALANPLSKSDLSAIESYNKLIDDGIDGQVAFAQTMKGTSNAAQGLVQSAKGSKVAIDSVKTASIGGKVALLGMKTAALLMNAALTMGISLLIDFAISGIMKLVNAKKELAEKVDEITSKFKEQHEELQKLKGDYDTTDESSMISKYEKLSKGVDNLGKNVSLTADEYTEYQNIVNQIADQIPDLVVGYDSQGNAILSCAGNVDKLTAAYENLIKAQNNEILDNSKDIEKDFKNKMKDFYGEGADVSYDNIKLLEEALDGKYSRNKIEEVFYLSTSVTDVVDALKEEGLAQDIPWYSGYDTYWDAIYDAINNHPDKVREVIDNFESDVNSTTDEIKTIAQAALGNAFDISKSDYADMSDVLKSVAYQIVDSFDAEKYKSILDSGETIETYVGNVLEQLNSISAEDTTKIETGFELKTEFNGGNISYGQYISQLQETIGFIDDLKVSDEVKNQIKLSLNSEDILADYNALVHDLKNIGFDDTSINKFLNSLSAEEFSAAMKIIPNLDAGTTINEIQALIDEQLATEFKFDITVQAEGVEAFNTALAESRSAAGLTSESITALKARYEDLDGFNAAALFEKTANGIHLNSEELSRLEEQYINTNKLDIENNLNKLVIKYNDLTEEIKGCTDAQEKEKLQNQANDYKDKIDELSTLASQYDGLTSAFAKWQTALEGAEEGDNYDSLYENLESIKELYNKGLVGTDKFKTAVQLMTDKDLANADIDEIVNAYKKGYPKMQRYFTEGQKGCKNFLNDVRKLNSEWAHMNKDGSWEINFNAEEVAKELDVSVDFVLQIAKKLKDYGFEVNFDDSSLDNLKTKIEQTEAKLKELGQSPVDINVDIEASSKNLGTIESEIEKAKSKIKEINNSSIEPKVKTAQLEDAQAKLEALIDKKIEASQPAFMNLNTSQVNASLVDALEKIQSYQDAINEVNKLSELKEAGITIDDSQLQKAKEKVDECAKAIQGLDGEVKMAIGLEEDGSIDSIKQSFEDGKVKIDADTDPAITKIEQLAENVERIEDKNVTINVTVNGLDKVKELNKQIDLATNIDGDIDKLSEYVENAKALSDLDDNIASYVTANIDGNVKDIPEFSLNNLEVFAEGAKALKGVGTFSSKVTADIDGNVITTPEYAINNLKVFSDSAANVEEIGNVASKVTANVDGNVIDTKEYKINNLKTYAESAKDVYKIGNVESSVKATVNTGEDGDVVDTFEYKLNNLGEFAKHAQALQGLSDVDISVSATVNTGKDGDVVDEFEYKLNNLGEFADHVTKLQGLPEETSVNVSATINSGKDGDVIDEFEYKLNNLSKFADHVRDLQGLDNVDISVDATVNTGKDGDVVEEFEYKLNNLGEFAKHARELQGLEDVKVNVTATVNSGEDGDVIDEFEYKLNNLSEFAEHVRGLQGLNDVDVSVSAKVNTGDNGDVVDTFEYKLNNLGEFAEHVKDLQGLSSVDISVSAKVNTGESGDVVDTFEYKLNNLSEFAKHVKALQGLENADVSVSANVDGDVIWHPEAALNNLSTFAESAKELADVESVSRSITANIDGDVVWHPEGMLNNLKEFAEGARELANTENVSRKLEANIGGDAIWHPEGMLNNLKAYSDGARELANTSDVSRKIEANIDGDAIWHPEGMLNNLGTFVEGAKELESISDVSRKITANIDGDAIWHPEGMLNNLAEFAEGAKTLEGLPDDISKTITANVDGDVIWTPEKMIDNVKVFAQSAKTLNGVPDDIDKSVSADVNGNVLSTSESNISKLGVFADNAKKAKDVGNFTSSVTASVGGNIITDDTAVSDLEHFASVAGGMTNQTVTVSVTANVDSANINSAITLLTNLNNSGIFKDYNATVQVGATIATIDDTKVKNYKAPPKDGKVRWLNDETIVDEFKQKIHEATGKVKWDDDTSKLKKSFTANGTVTWTSGNNVKVNVVSKADGTAQASGSTNGRAFARGNWGIKGNGVALGGELGRELVVRDGRFFTIGDNGAEFFRYRKNDIVFNAAQTESLFKYGGIKGAKPRGTMLASGSAFVEGNAFAYNSKVSGGGLLPDDTITTIKKETTTTTTTTSNGSSSKSSSSKSSSSSSDNKDFKETFDWVEIAISRIERAIDKLDKKANNVYKSWSERNSALASEISKVGDKIALQQSAYNRYIQEANSVGLSSSWVKKVREGTIDISTITDENLKEKIDDYKKWYDKALECQDAIEDLRETEAKLYAQRFENIQTQYDGILQGYEHTESMLNKYISQAEAQGHIISEKYYNALIENEKQNIAELKKEQSNLIAERDKAVAEGKIVKGSEAWLKQCLAIDEVTQSIEEANIALIEYSNSIRDINWQIFDLIEERISDVTSESEFLIELMSNKDLFDDNGKLTGQGVATMGLYAQNYNTHMYQADEIGAEIAKLDKQIAEDPYDQELINRRRELVELQREQILAAEDCKNSIKSLLEEGYERELDLLQEKINKTNEAIDSQRDLYDYQRKVEESTENIASLRKRLASYESFDDEETRALTQKLKLELSEAESDLQETEWDRYIDQQSQLLDTLYTEYEAILNSRLDNIDYLLQQVIDGINATAGEGGTLTSALGAEGAIAQSIISAVGENGSIKNILNTEANNVGTTLSTAMNNIWSTGEGNAKSVLTTYGTDFQNKLTTTNATLNGIKVDIGRMVDDVDKDAQKKVTANKTSTSAKKDPTKTTTTTKKPTTTTKNTTTNKSSGGDGIPKVGDKVKFVSGKYYYDSYGTKPLGYHNLGKYVYVTHINKKGTHPYHISTGSKLGKGDLGWLKLNQISGYATGKKNFLDDETAWTQEKGREFIVRPSDGAILTPVAKGDSVLNAQASNNIWDMANSPAEFIKNNLGLDGANIPSGANVNNTYSQHIDNVVFRMDNVKNYDEMLSAMQKDKNFERLVLSMSIDRLAGKSSLAKGKSIR